jgi:hypothetical protein
MILIACSGGDIPRVEASGEAGGPAVAASSGPSLAAADTVIRTERWPHRAVTVDDAFSWLGSRTIRLGSATAEIHVLVDTDDTGTSVERLYWIQFEGYPPESPNRYDYSSQPHADTIGDFEFLAGVRHGAYTAAEVENESDTRTVAAILAEHGLSFPAPMMRDRMVTLDANRRNELLVIYMESLAPLGLTDEELGADEARWAEVSAGLRSRAVAGLGLGEPGGEPGGAPSGG